MATGKEYDVTEVGSFAPVYHPEERLLAGEVGYLAASIKDISDTRVGDTVTGAENPAKEPLPGYKEVKPWSTAGFTPPTARIMKTCGRHWAG
jgi:GTP-binding protein LepA